MLKPNDTGVEAASGVEAEVMLKPKLLLVEAETDVKPKLRLRCRYGEAETAVVALCS